MNSLPNEDSGLSSRRDEILSATSFVANALLQSSSWRDAIDVVLARLGKSVKANRAYYFESHLFSDGVELTSQVAEWTADAVEPQIDNQDLQNVPWEEAGMGRWLRWMKERKPIFGLIADFPECEREVLESQQIQSLIAMPVFVQNAFAGFLGFDDCETLREWSPSEFDALSAAATALGAAIQRQQLEHQLRYAQKMEAVGSLATGVAHDFNNMLQVISAFTAIAKLKLDTENSANSDLDEVLAATGRAQCLTRHLLTFSTAQQRTNPTNVDTNELCRSVMSMVRPILGSKIDILDSLPDDSPVIYADSGLISHVLLNLCLNSRDAMPNGGRIEISSGRRKLVESELEQFAATTPGDYAVISVMDNGIGMNAELQDRIFKPFFTTKEDGQGTGLGLSVAFGSVRQSGGFIDVSSKPNEGSRFDLYFPLVCEAMNERSAVETRTPTILLVDDEPIVLATTKLLIESIGCKVRVAKDGVEALRVFEEHADEIDLTIADTAMPRMNGIALRIAILSITPHAKFIALTGCIRDTTSTELSNSKNLVVLDKPVRPEELIPAIRDMLDAARVDERP